MQIDPPTSVGHRVPEEAPGKDIVLGEDMASPETTALPLARQAADPIQRPVRGIRMVARILHVIPYAERDAQELVADGYRTVGHGVEMAAPFKPPVPVLIAPNRAVLKVGPLKLADPGGSKKGLGRGPAAGREQDGTPQGLGVSALRCERFPEGLPTLAPPHNLRPGRHPQGSIPGAIRKESRPDLKLLLRGGADGLQKPDRLAPPGTVFSEAARAGRVEQQGQVRLGHRFS